MKSFVVSLVGATVITLVVPQSSLAQYYNSYHGGAGPYSYVGIGPAFTEDGKVREFTGFTAGNKIRYDTGFALEVAVGYAFNDWVSVELEAGWIGSEIQSVQGFTHDDTFLYNAPFLASVTLQHRIPQTIITPYVRAAVGGSATVFDTDGFSNGTITLFGYDSDLVFAYQFSAGVRFDLNDQMSIGVGYKYFATEDSSFEYGSFSGGGPVVRLGIEGVRTHVVTVSFNMKF